MTSLLQRKLSPIFTLLFLTVAFFATAQQYAENNTNKMVADPLFGGGIAASSYCVFPGNPPSPTIETASSSDGVQPYTYQWQMWNATLGTWTVIPGENRTTLQPGLITETTKFRRKTIDKVNSEAFSNEITYTLVNTPLYSGAISYTGANPVCVGNTPINISNAADASSALGNVTYIWEYKTDGNPVWTELSNTNSADFTVSSVSEKTYFRRVAIDQCGITKRMEPTAEIIVDVFPALVNSTIPTSFTIASGGTPAPLSAPAFIGGYGTINYQWEVGTSATGPWTDVPSATTLNFQPPAIFATAYYRLRGFDLCNTSHTNVVTYNVVAPLYPGNITTTSTCVPSGSQPATITENAAASDGAQPYTHAWEFWNATLNTWTVIPGETGLTLTPPAITETTKYRRKTTDANLQSAYSNEVTITVNATVVAGVITPANQTVSLNVAPAPFSLSTFFSGGTGSFSYQWQAGPSASGPWTNIPGETSTTYQAPASPSDAIIYFRVLATDLGCNGTLATSSVKLTVTSIAPLYPGNITTTSTCVPSGSQPAIITENAAASDGLQPYVHAWEFWNATLNTWTIIPGETGTSLVPPAITETTKYRRKTTDSNGSFAYTNEVTITVNPAVVPGVITPSSMVVAANIGPSNPFELTTLFTGGTGSFTYQWQTASSASGPWVDIAGETGTSYLSPGANVDTTIYYRIVATDALCNGTSFSNTVFIDVNAAATLFGGSITTTGTCIPFGNQTTLITENAASSDGIQPYTYFWQYWTATAGSWVTIPGETGTTLAPQTITENTSFRRGTIDQNIDTAYSNEIMFYYQTTPLVPGTITASSSLCISSGSTPGMLQNGTSASGGSGIFTYQWEMNVNNGGWNPISGATNEIYTPAEPITSNTEFRRKVSDNCGFAYSDTLLFTIAPAIDPGSIESGSACSISAAILTSVSPASGGSFTYQWQKKIKGGNWQNLTGETNADLTDNSFNQKSEYRRLALGTCGDTTISNVVTVFYNYGTFSNQGIIYATTPVVCAGTAPGSILSAVDDCSRSGAVTYSWAMYDYGTGQYTTIPGANGATLPNPPAFSTIGNGAVYFRVATDVCGNQFGTPPVYILDYSINVYSAPVLPSNQVICASSNALPQKLVYQSECNGSVGPIVYQWQFYDNGVWVDISGANTDEYQPAANQPYLMNYYRLKLLVGPCQKEVYSMQSVIEINPGCRTSGGQPIVDKGNKKNLNVTEGKLAAPSTTKTINPGDLVIYPNPAKSNSELTIIVTTSGRASLTMQSLDGKQIPVRTTSLGTGLMKVKLPNEIAKGIYFIQVKDGQKSWVEKLVIN